MRMRVMEHDSCALTFGPSSTASTADAGKKLDGVNDRPRGWCPSSQLPRVPTHLRRRRPSLRRRGPDRVYLAEKARSCVRKTRAASVASGPYAPR